MEANNKPSKQTLSRRHFITACAGLPFLTEFSFEEPFTNSVNGKINVSNLGVTLIHEHVLVDFIGGDKISADRWKHDEVIAKALPHLSEIKKRGIQSFVECTPAYIGRDVLLLQKLSEKSGLNILTNTGYYGASDNKYLPAFAFKETAEQLANRWIAEFENGIEGTRIKPGFIKTGVNSGPLSEIHQKLIKAAALTHLKTGLTICSHTGPATPAQEELDILLKSGVSATAFVWVHASGSNDDFQSIGKSGCWISLDGVNEDNVEKSAELISFLKQQGFIKQILVSHDAGWYRPGEPNGGDFRGYTTISDKLLPLLKTKGFTDADIRQMMVGNPANAFAIRVRKV
ncbi:phosphotriesterase family protein [Dyadobacter psychrophilus]|uniref:Phosphotriesterase-related protein n=1 Tax=Dyadobacter psychrophilus TaxID=651661 RepID=A0A1T5BQP2_9BACT|nr:aryldialkylphosphatase [Dyadobacter psychrophilus]SKB49474.1 phosphotriesterase-related protein [Dyadobacter psychrophilus]